jgi:hypothetical protein
MCYASLGGHRDSPATLDLPDVAMRCAVHYSQTSTMPHQPIVALVGGGCHVAVIRDVLCDCAIRVRQIGRVADVEAESVHATEVQQLGFQLWPRAGM